MGFSDFWVDRSIGAWSEANGRRFFIMAVWKCWNQRGLARALSVLVFTSFLDSLLFDQVNGETKLVYGIKNKFIWWVGESGETLFIWTIKNNVWISQNNPRHLHILTHIPYMVPLLLPDFLVSRPIHTREKLFVVTISRANFHMHHIIIILLNGYTSIVFPQKSQATRLTHKTLT